MTIRSATKSEKLTNYRWVIAIGYAFAITTIAVVCLGTAPLVNSLSEHWGVSFSSANWSLSVIFGLLGGLLAFPAGILADRIGWKRLLGSATLLVTLGSFFRGIAQDWTVFMVSSVIIAVGWGLSGSGMGKMIRSWFPRREIGMATGIAVIGYPLGTTLGILLVVPLMDNLGWRSMWFSLSVVAALGFVVVWLGLKEVPLNTVESDVGISGHVNVVRALKQTMNRDNVALQFVRLFVFGLGTIPPILVPIRFASLGFPLSTAGVILGFWSMIGIFSTLVVPGIAVRKMRVKLTLLIFLVLSAISIFSIFILPLTSDTAWIAILLILILGFVTPVIFTLTMSIGQLQPGVTSHNAGILVGVFMTTAGLGTFLIPSIVGYLVDQGGLSQGVWLQTFAIIISIFLVIYYVAEPKVEES